MIKITKNSLIIFGTFTILSVIIALIIYATFSNSSSENYSSISLRGSVYGPRISNQKCPCNANYNGERMQLDNGLLPLVNSNCCGSCELDRIPDF